MSFDHAAGLDPHAVEDDRTIQPRPGGDLGAAPDDSAADVLQIVWAFLFFGVRTRYLNEA
jgi:hypothetical protein